MGKLKEIMPVTWRLWAVETPDETKNVTELLASGKASAIDAQWTVCNDLQAHIEARDPTMNNAFAASYSKLIEEAEETMTEAQTVISGGLILKVIYVRMETPGMRAQAKTQLVRDTNNVSRATACPRCQRWCWPD